MSMQGPSHSLLVGIIIASVGVPAEAGECGHCDAGLVCRDTCLSSSQASWGHRAWRLYIKRSDLKLDAARLKYPKHHVV